MGVPQATLITGFCSIVLNLSHQCVRLCCSVCIFEDLCVMSESKVWFCSRKPSFLSLPPHYSYQTEPPLCNKRYCIICGCFIPILQISSFCCCIVNVTLKLLWKLIYKFLVRNNWLWAIEFLENNARYTSGVHYFLRIQWPKVNYSAYTTVARPDIGELQHLIQNIILTIFLHLNLTLPWVIPKIRETDRWITLMYRHPNTDCNPKLHKKYKLVLEIWLVNHNVVPGSTKMLTQEHITLGSIRLCTTVTTPQDIDQMIKAFVQFFYLKRYCE